MSADPVHEQFLEGVKASHPKVEFFADWLRRKGWQVQVMPQRLAPTRAQWREFSDNGDLRVWKPGGDAERWEVKHRSLEFTCERDFPFRTVMVCTVFSFDNADPKPTEYIMLSAGLTHGLLINAKTKHLWTQQDRSDRRFPGEIQRCYYCPKSAARFFKL